MKYTKLFSQVNLHDTNIVGGKNASLGQLTQFAHAYKINIPDGFASTSQAYWYFIKHNNLAPIIKKFLDKIKNYQDTKELTKISKKIRTQIETGEIPADLAQELITGYKKLSSKTCFVALRSSGTAEDLPNASFAGQHDSFLYIRGIQELLNTWKKCISSLFTPRAIAYRIINKISHEHVALSVGIQHMINAQKSGVIFTIDTESGFDGVIFITAVYGSGELIVQGKITPDQYYVHKDRLTAGFKPILTKTCGTKNRARIFNKKLHDITVSKKQQEIFCLSDTDIMELARQSLAIEIAYSAFYKKYTPMDIEWIQAPNKKLYIVQARPETVHSKKTETTKIIYTHKKNINSQNILLTGQAIGQQIISGPVFVSKNIAQATDMPDGAVLVTSMTTPDWVPIMKKAAAIITDQGGRTCHAAIVSRELGIPALVGTQIATTTLHTGQMITLDCSAGMLGAVYAGKIRIQQKSISLNKTIPLPISIMLNISIPTSAFSLATLPVTGVGLARTEFIIAHTIQVHPLALIHIKQLPKTTQTKIKNICSAYASPKEFFINVLAQQCATIAAAFWPKSVIVRLSDFKSNEYRNLIGGKYFEQQEQNPMLGNRGAFRYYGTPYNSAFKLECTAIKQAREVNGFTNIQLMIPMIRSTQEAKIITKLLQKTGLYKTQPRMQTIFMCETPACALEIQKIAKYCDGFSIGSNDLAQFTLAIDREDATLANTFNEQDPAVLTLIDLAITGAHDKNKKIGICGQAPSDYPEFFDWLVKHKIDYISLNSDAVIQLLGSTPRYNAEDGATRGERLV